MAGGAGIVGSDTGIGVHGKRKVAVDEIDLSGVDVIFNDALIGGGEKLFASGALKIAENFHGDRRVLGAEGLGGVDVGDAIDGDGLRGSGGSCGVLAIGRRGKEERTRDGKGGGQAKSGKRPAIHRFLR
jgi:hypothetical protein